MLLKKSLSHFEKFKDVSMIRAYLFVESPFQLLNAYEAITYFKLKQYRFYIRLSGNQANDTQIKYLIERFKIKKDAIVFIHIHSMNKQISDVLKLLFYRIRFLFTANIDYVFIGNYESRFFKLILRQFQREKIVLLDDGTQTISIQKQFSDNNFYDIFSMYDLKPYKEQNIYPNSFNMVKNTVNTKITDNYILFFGTKLYEEGIINKEHYINLMNKISQYFKDKKILYVTHRGEEESKLEQIGLLQNITVTSFDYPVELFGFYNNNLPEYTASFYSAALYSMYKIYEVKALSFYFNFKNFKLESNINNVYNYYRKHMPVISLEG